MHRDLIKRLYALVEEWDENAKGFEEGQDYTDCAYDLRAILKSIKYSDSLEIEPVDEFVHKIGKNVLCPEPLYSRWAKMIQEREDLICEKLNAEHEAERKKLQDELIELSDRCADLADENRLLASRTLLPEQ